MNEKMTSINKYSLVLSAVEIKVAAVIKKRIWFWKNTRITYLLIFCIISFSVSGWDRSGPGHSGWGNSSCSWGYSRRSCCGCSGWGNSGSSQGWNTSNSTGLWSTSNDATGLHFSNLMVEPFWFIKIAIANDKGWKNDNDKESSKHLSC